MFDFITDADLRAKAESEHKKSLESTKNELTTAFETRLGEETQGMRAKMDELLNEKKTLAEKFKDITDPQAALEALKFINDNADAQLIKDGRVDELIQKKTTALRQEHEATVNELTKQVKELSEGKGKYKGLFQTKVIEDALRDAAIKAGVRMEAVPDVLMRGRGVFSLGSNYEVEARDGKGNLKKTSDDMVLTPVLWINSLKTEAPHYWPGSEGAGASGGGAGGGGDIEEELARLAEKGDMVGYRKLREKQLQGKV